MGDLWYFDDDGVDGVDAVRLRVGGGVGDTGDCGPAINAPNASSSELSQLDSGPRTAGSNPVLSGHRSTSSMPSSSDSASCMRWNTDTSDLMTPRGASPRDGVEGAAGAGGPSRTIDRATTSRGPSAATSTSTNLLRSSSTSTTCPYDALGGRS